MNNAHTSIDHQLGLLLIKIGARGKYDLLQIAEQYNLTLMQAICVCLLDPDTTVPMKFLSDALRTDPSTITSMVERLVATKFLIRQEAPYDRRVKTIALTEKGQALRQQLINVSSDKRLPGLKHLTKEELILLVALLKKAFTKL